MSVFYYKEDPRTFFQLEKAVEKIKWLIWIRPLSQSLLCLPWRKNIYKKTASSVIKQQLQRKKEEKYTIF